MDRDSIPSPLKSMLRPSVTLMRRALASQPARRMITSNFSTGKVAFGEKNKYIIDRSWVTVDMEGADFCIDLRTRNPVPFADSSQQCVYSAHMIEHIDPSSLQFFFNEVFRILKAGGGLCLDAPDTELIYNRYKSGDLDFFQPYCEDNRALMKTKGLPAIVGEPHIAFIGLISCFMDDCHVPVLASKNEVDAKLASLSMEDFAQWCVSLQTPSQYTSGGHITPVYWSKLKHMLERAGFRTIRRREAGKTSMQGIDLKRIERLAREDCSIYLEAIK